MKIQLIQLDTKVYRHTYARELNLESKTVLIAENVTGRFEPEPVDGFHPWEKGTNLFGFNVFVCESTT